MNRKQKWLPLILLVFFILGGISFAFQNEPDGFQGIKWGTIITKDTEGFYPKIIYEPNYTVLGSKVNKPNIVYNNKKIDLVSPSSFHYICYENKFMMLRLKFKASNFYEAEEILTGIYGKPTMTKNPTVDLDNLPIVRKWIGDTTTIKMKTNRENIKKNGNSDILIYSTKIYEEYIQFRTESQ
jgi:hypothetical protein